MKALLLLLPLVFSFVLASSKPNILFLILDDIGFTDVSFHGSEIKTPNIDSLVNTGVRLEGMHVQPVCSPTRSSLMTGRYPFRMGMQHFETVRPGSNAGIPPDTPTLPEMLSKVGYTSSIVGKWHLGSGKWRQVPTNRGFESFVGYLNAQIDYYNKTVEDNYDFWNNTKVFHEADGKYSMEQYLAEFHRLVNYYTTEEGKKDPFFMYFAHQVVHIPLEYPDQAAKYQARCKGITDSWRFTYCTMMSRLDDAIGEIVHTLKQAGLWDNTVLFMTTDNGGMVHYDPDWPASAGVNFPLRGGKVTLFEGGVRAGVAAINGGATAFAPEDSPIRGKVNKGLWHVTDFTHTALALAGADIPSSVSLDSFNAWPSLVNASAPINASPRTEVPININFNGTEFTSLRVGDWKLIVGKHGPYDGYYQIPPAPYLPPPSRPAGHYMLFNIAADPTEQEDLHLRHPSIVKSILDRLSEIMEAGYEAPQNNDQVCNPTNGVWIPC